MPTPLQRIVDELSGPGLVDLSWSLGLLIAPLLAGWLLARLLFGMLRRWARRTDTPADDRVIGYLSRPLRWLVPLLLLRAALPLTTFSDAARSGLGHACLIGVILAIGWLLSAVVRSVEEVVNTRFDTGVADNLHARAVHTQMRGFRNIARFAIGLISIASVLVTFQSVRQLGVSLLASAGVAGVVIGFAAQRSIATVVAGLQIALTQPIRVDDVVIVEGEWGWVEEITLTYVVVRVWDLRRLVVPITYFIERPFQNWTRVSADLLGTVFLYTDYTVSVDALRAELDHIVEHSPHWDGKTRGLVVTNAGERALELRALVSAEDSSKLWDLRCEVREKLVAYLQREHPGSLPVLRASLDRQSSAV